MTRTTELSILFNKQLIEGGEGPLGKKWCSEWSQSLEPGTATSCNLLPNLSCPGPLIFRELERGVVPRPMFLLNLCQKDERERESDCWMSGPGIKAIIKS